MATTAYHGLDSNSNPVDDSCYDDFYLGEMGMGAFIGDSQVFNSYYCMQFSNIGDTDNTNNYAGWMVNNGRDNTYGYWFLLGPMLANPNNSQSSYTCSNGEVISGYESYTVDTPSEAYNWGQKQAKTAITAWNDSNLYNNIVRKTIFGDVEQANASGWYPSSFGVINGYEYYELNRQVIIGFIEELINSGYPAGIYTDPYDWNTITNSWTGLDSYTSHLWVADWSASGCLPTWNAPSVGGVVAQIWQYSGGSLDLDAAISLPS